jgi:endonuclease-3
LRGKIIYIQDILDSLYPNPTVPLHHSDPFTLLIAVLLSAQCQDSRVNQVTPALFKLASTPLAMSKLPLSQIEETIRTLGLYKTKAKAIQSLSKILVEEFGSIVPRALEKLETLPGVGHKTASVVLCQAFQIPAFPVDTHIHRCAKRWGLSNGKSVEQTEKDLKKLFPITSWCKVHIQIILFARAYCPAKSHNIPSCPICQKWGQAWGIGV